MRRTQKGQGAAGTRLTRTAATGCCRNFNVGCTWAVADLNAVVMAPFPSGFGNAMAADADGGIARRIFADAEVVVGPQACNCCSHRAPCCLDMAV